MALEIHLLGPPKVRRGDSLLPLRGHRPFALLAYLVVTGKAHTRTHLTDLLFSASADPRASLRWTLTKLRQAIGAEYLSANRQQVAFNDREPHICDVDALLGGDLACYRGSFLEGLSIAQAPAFEEWHLITGQQLRQVYQDGLLARITRHEMRGEHQDVAKLASRLVQMDSLREEWRRILMRAYAALGDWHAADAQYEQCRQLLLDELAATPSRKTTELWHQIRRRESTEEGSSASHANPMGSMTRRERNTAIPDGEMTQPAKLPFYRTSFVGREKEIRDIQTTLADPDCRLLTVFGPGGIGKTRLAVQAAINLEQRYEQGISFVAMRQVASASAMPSAIARALGLSSFSGESLRSQLLTYLQRRSALLVLDNMEHLLTADDWTEGEAFLAELLASASGVEMLATSRARLHMPEEWLCFLEGLSFPSNGKKAPGELAAYPAVQLFLQRARQIDPTYRPEHLNGDNIASVVNICQRTQGMPLALELAAAWVNQMSSARIAHALADDLAILASPSLQGPARHASMQAVFEHSWQLLSRNLQRLLAQLSVFRGRFDREAAEAVTGSSLFELSALLDKSMLETGGDGRYQVHELLRQFAANKLQEEPALAVNAREAHSVFYCDYCRNQEQDIKGGDQIRATRRLERAMGNLEVAFAWAVEQGKWKRVADVTFTLGHFCSQQGHVEEGQALFARVIDAPSDETSPVQVLAQARATYWLGQLADAADAIFFWHQADKLYRQALHFGQGTDFDEALFEEALAQACQNCGDHIQEERHSQASLAAALRAGDAWVEAKAHHKFAGLLVWHLTRYRLAADHAEAALQLQRNIQDREGMAESLGMLCIIETFLRNYERAIQISREQLAISLETGNDLRAASAHRDVGWSLLLAGRFDECISHLHHALATYEYYGQEQRVSEVLYGLAWRNCMGGHYDEAHRYADDLEVMLANKPDRLNRGVFLYVRSQIAFHDGCYEAALDNARESYEILAQIGSHNQQALALITLGFANLAHDNLQGAFEQARDLLSMKTVVALWGLSVVALVLVKQQPCQALCEEFHELLALQRHASPMCNSPSYRTIIEQLQPPEVEQLSAECRAMAEARGPAMDPDAVIQALRERFLETG